MEEVIQQVPVIQLDNAQKDVLRREVKLLEVRERVKDLFFVKRWSLIDVLRELRIAPNILRQHIDAIKKQLTEQVREDFKKETITSAFHGYRNVVAAAWVVYETARSNTEKLRALELVNVVEEKNIDVLQKLGVIDKPSEKLEVTYREEFDKMIIDWRRARERIVKEAEVVLE